jgi:ABC-type dipeptide/oligopeptide/nickel transport system permease subunit
MNSRRLSFSAGISTVILSINIIAAAGSAILAPFDPVEQNLDARFLPPGSEGHLMGTDHLGRDVLSRLVYGARSAVIVGTVSCAIALTLGMIAGVGAAMAPRWLDSLIMLVMDGVLAIPAILMAMAVVALFGYGIVPVMIAMGIIFSPLIARLVRAEVRKAWNSDFVEGEILLNRSHAGIFFSIIVPEAAPPVLVQVTSLFAASVTIEASLSFLGIGIQPPAASWGMMLNNARDYIFSAPWLALPPGIALALLVYSLNTLGDLFQEDG